MFSFKGVKLQQEQPDQLNFSEKEQPTHTEMLVGEGFLLLRLRLVPHLWSAPHHHVLPTYHILLKKKKKTKHPGNIFLTFVLAYLVIYPSVKYLQQQGLYCCIKDKGRHSTDSRFIHTATLYIKHHYFDLTGLSPSLLQLKPYNYHMSRTECFII